MFYQFTTRPNQLFSNNENVSAMVVNEFKFRITPIN